MVRALMGAAWAATLFAASVASPSHAQPKGPGLIADEIDVQVTIEDPQSQDQIVSSVFSPPERGDERHTYWDELIKEFRKPPSAHEIVKAQKEYLRIKRQWLGNEADVAIEQFSSIHTKLRKAGLSPAATERAIGVMRANIAKVRAKSLVSIVIGKSAEALVVYGVQQNGSSGMHGNTGYGVDLTPFKRRDALSPDTVMLDTLNPRDR